MAAWGLTGQFMGRRRCRCEGPNSPSRGGSIIRAREAQHRVTWQFHQHQEPSIKVVLAVLSQMGSIQGLCNLWSCFRAPNMRLGIGRSRSHL